MSTPLLATKLYIPPVRAEWVRRPHLIHYLDEGLRQGHRLTLISAPAGSGKTSLVSAWAGQAENPFAWVSLDEDDNAPVRFLIYLIAALQTTDPSCGEAVLVALQSPQPPPARSVLPFLLHDVTTCPDVVLVLDDYHVIKERAVHDLVDFLLQHLPLNLHLVIATRADPPLPLPRLRGRQQLSELRPPDLRFTDEEATAFFAGTMGLELSSQDVSALNTRTEGWITGLRMAAMSMRGRDDTSAFVRSFTGSNRYILDYLVEEVLQQQPEDIQTFLLHTSILSDLSGDLCGAVTGRDDGQHILEEMERANLFVVLLDDRRQWFRYHHLFADLLRQRLRLSASDSIPELHRRASAWYKQNNLLARAVEHALAAGDYEYAACLIGQQIGSIWEYGEQAALTKWLATLPDDVVHQHPTLLASHAFALCFAGQFELAEAQLDLAQQRATSGHDLVRGMAATVRAYIALYGNDADAAAEYAHLALEHLPAGHHLWRCLATSILGDAHAFYGHVPTSERTWSQALREAEAAGSTFFSLHTSAKLVVAQKRQGRLQQADETFREQVERALQRGISEVAVAGALYAVWGDVLLEWDRVDEALENIQRGLALSDRQHYIAGVAWSSLSLIHAHFARADLYEAEKALHHLEQRIRHQDLPRWTMCWLSAWKSRLLVARGDLAGAERVLRERGLTLDGRFHYPREVEYLALARLLMAKGLAQPQSGCLCDAERLLSRLRDHLESAGWVDKALEAQVLQALVLQARGQERVALETLAEVLVLAEPESYTRLFVREGPRMARLLYKALERGGAAAYVSHLLAAFPAPRPEPLAPSQVDLIEPLSERELDVLRLVAGGATNREVALSLHLALGTVKNHLKNIYGKLNVHSRTQAAARGRDLGLID